MISLPPFGGLEGGVRGGGVGGDRYERDEEYPMLRYLSVKREPLTYNSSASVCVGVNDFELDKIRRFGPGDFTLERGKCAMSCSDRSMFLEKSRLFVSFPSHKRQDALDHLRAWLNLITK
jgi:hypothetical protein